LPHLKPLERPGDELQPLAQTQTRRRVPCLPRGQQGPGTRSKLRERAADAKGHRFARPVDLRLSGRTLRQRRAGSAPIRAWTGGNLVRAGLQDALDPARGSQAPRAISTADARVPGSGPTPPVNA